MTVEERGNMASRDHAPTTSAATAQEPRHTPGPWTVHTNTGDGGYVDPEWSGYEIHSEDWTLAMVLTDANAISSDANARLIAAAPDLLEAARNMAVAIDAYARGEADCTHLETMAHFGFAAIAKATAQAHADPLSLHSDGEG